MTHFPDLDDETRALALDELTSVDELSPYISSLIRPERAARYVELLHEALQGGSPEGLAGAIWDEGLLDATQQTKSGPRRITQPAAVRLAEGEFGRYYARAICRRALDASPDARVEVYRARASASPRRESEDAIGSRRAADDLLEALRASRVDPTLEIPQVNSGLNVRLEQ